MRSVLALRDKPFCLSHLHICKINIANKSSSKILLSKDSLPKHLPDMHPYIKEADAIQRSVKHTNFTEVDVIYSCCSEQQLVGGIWLPVESGPGSVEWYMMTDKASSCSSWSQQQCSHLVVFDGSSLGHILLVHINELPVKIFANISFVVFVWRETFNNFYLSSAFFCYLIVGSCSF